MRFSVVLLGCLFSLGCGGGPESASRSERRAAIAIRDEVPGYQAWGSERFTRPVLDSGYARSWYLTEEPGSPQRAAFQDALRDAAAGYDSVDLYLLTHCNTYYLDWAEELDGSVRAKLRLVYNTGAGGASLGPRWVQAGAQSYVGHPSGNVAPVFYAYFLPAWTGGESLDEAVSKANERTKSHLQSALASRVYAAVHFVGGVRLDADRLWAGTEAQVFRRAATSPAR